MLANPDSHKRLSVLQFYFKTMDSTNNILRHMPFSVIYSSMKLVPPLSHFIVDLKIEKFETYMSLLTIKFPTKSFFISLIKHQ